MLQEKFAIFFFSISDKHLSNEQSQQRNNIKCQIEYFSVPSILMVCGAALCVHYLFKDP